MDRSRTEMIVNKSEQMQKDGTGYKKAETIIWFQDHAYTLLPSAYHGYRNLFLTWCCTEDPTRIEIPCDKDMLYDDLISNFRRWCDLVSKFGDLSMLDKLEENVEEADKIFVTLVRLVHSFLNQTKAIRLTTEEIADIVLERMADYYENIYFRASMTIEEELMKSLVYQLRDTYASA